MDPAQAVIVAVPEATPYALPRFKESAVVELPESFVIVATALFEELQMTEANVSAPPPLKFPVAVMPKNDPMGTHVLLGPNVIESRPGGVSEAGWYSSALERNPVLPYPPLTNTFPLLRRVPVC